MTTMSVRIDGADQALRALRTMEPETAKQVAKEISSVGRMLAAYINADAPSAPPMRGWRTKPTMNPHHKKPSRGGSGWDSDVAWSPIRARSARRGTSVVISTQSSNFSAIIYESAGVKGGRKSRGAPGSGDGDQFIANLQRPPYGPLVQSGKYQGRLARRAIKQNYGQVLRDIEQACERAVIEVNRRMP
jgi:hypothetical protein